MIKTRQMLTVVLRDQSKGRINENVSYNDIITSRIIQVTMLRAKFGRIKIRTNLLQRFDNNFGHFDNKFCNKFD